MPKKGLRQERGIQASQEENLNKWINLIWTLAFLTLNDCFLNFLDSIVQIVRCRSIKARWNKTIGNWRGD